MTIILIRQVRGLSYSRLTRKISWLLMLWPLTSPGHQHPWYCNIGYVKMEALVFHQGGIPATCVVSVWRKYVNFNYIFMIPLENLACYHTHTIWSSSPVLSCEEWIGVHIAYYQIIYNKLTTRHATEATWWYRLPLRCELSICACQALVVLLTHIPSQA